MPSKSEEHSPPLWLWPNLLSLDAPLVAVLWQGFLAYRFALPLRPAGRLVLGLTVWAIYLLDRLLDARKPPPVKGTAEPARHRYYRRHFELMAALLAIVIAADAFVAMVWLRPAVLRVGLILLAGVLVYLATFHISGLSAKIPKEIAAAVLFTAGTFLTAWSTIPCLSLAWPAVAFFLLCLANIVAIEVWEWLRASRRRSTGAASLHALPGTHLSGVGAGRGDRVRFAGTQRMVRIHRIERGCLRGAGLAGPPPVARSAPRAGGWRTAQPHSVPDREMNADRIASSYRWLEYAAFGPALEQARFDFLSHAAQARRVLILGEGDGRFLARLLECNPRASVAVIESSARMIQLARQRVPPDDRTRVEFHHLDAACQPWPEGPFDLAVTHFFLDILTFPEAESVILESQRCAVSGRNLAAERVSRASRRNASTACPPVAGCDVPLLPADHGRTRFQAPALSRYS